MYTLDTNIVIYFIQDDRSVVVSLRKILERAQPIYISPITEIELLRFPRLTLTEQTAISAILHSLTIITLDSQIARLAAALGRQYSLKLADSAIAATALFTGTILVTRNINDFKKVPNLKLLKL